MPKKTKNIIFIIILVVFAIVIIYNFTNQKKNARTDFGQIDTALITRFSVFPLNENRKEVTFFKENNKWFVQKYNVKSDTKLEIVRHILTEIKNMKPSKLLAESEKKQIDFEVNDTLANRLKIYYSEDEVLDLLIGKITFRQNQNIEISENGKQNNISATSYVRIYGEDEIYAVEGFLAFTFNQTFNTWRNQTIINVKKENLTKLSFKYPADSGFQIQKKDSVWIIGSKKTNKKKINEFLNLLSDINNYQFIDNYKISDIPVYEFTVEGNNMQPVIVKCYPGPVESVFIIHSSANPDAYFTSKKNELIHVFKKKADFLSD